MKLVREYGALATGVLCSFLITLYAANFPFFWDTIQLGSEHANWYYTNGFDYLLLSDNLDSGHCPLFGIYLAAMWTLFGKSLVASHFAMFPFLVLVVFFIIRIGAILTGDKFRVCFLFLLFCNPYFLGQSVLVSPDIVLLAFLLISLDAYLRSNVWQLLLGAIGLSLISQRGLMIVMVLCAWILVNGFLESKRIKLSTVKFILPGIALAIAYQLFHYLSKGWIGYHPASPWADSFQTVSSFNFLIKNTGVFLWRLIDYGNFVIWFGLIVILVKGGVSDKRLLWLIVMLIGAFALVIIPKVGLLNHRYFLPIIVVGLIGLLELLYKSTIRFKYHFVFLAGIITLTGNLWTYPEGVAQGWDTTLSHTPYYELFDDALIHIKRNGIRIDEIGTAFPAKNKVSDIYLNDNENAFKPFDLETDKYILYSNVMNDFQSEHIFELDNLWKPIFKKVKGNICIILFERK